MALGAQQLGGAAAPTHASKLSFRFIVRFSGEVVKISED